MCSSVCVYVCVHTQVCERLPVVTISTHVSPLGRTLHNSTNTNTTSHTGTDHDESIFGPGTGGYGGDEDAEGPSGAGGARGGKGGDKDSGGGTAEAGWQVTVQLTQLNGRRGAVAGRPRAYTPRYPKVRSVTRSLHHNASQCKVMRADSTDMRAAWYTKRRDKRLCVCVCVVCTLQPKDEGWFLVAGDTRTRELLALKRVGIDLPPNGHRGTCTTRLTVPRCNGAGQALSHVTLFLLSDSYLGLDQQVDVRLDSKAGQGAKESAGKAAAHEQPAANAAPDAPKQAQKQAEPPANWAPSSSGSSAGASVRGRGGGRKVLSMSEAITPESQGKDDEAGMYEDEPGCG